MASPVNDTYSAPSGATVYGGRFAPPANLPTALLDLIAEADENSWIKVNTNTFQSVWPHEDFRPLFPVSSGPSNPATVLRAWASFALDEDNFRLIFWGGGHANSNCNEVYIFDLRTLQWSLGFYPAEIKTVTGGMGIETVDWPATPQSSHTYHNQLWLPKLQRFISFGGAAQSSGGPWKFSDADGGRLCGPFTLDLSQAGQGKVGGTTGSNVKRNSTAEITLEGAEAWSLRDWHLDHPNPDNVLSFITTQKNGVAKYREENGHDVVYFKCGGASLMRYEFVDHDYRNDIISRVGRANGDYASSQGGWLDLDKNIFASIINATTVVLRCWNLNTAGPSNTDFRISSEGITGPDAAEFLAQMADSPTFGVDYDERRGRAVAWQRGGRVYSIQSPEGPDFTSGWAVTKLSDDTLDPRPLTVAELGPTDSGEGDVGVVGKWKWAKVLDCGIGVQKAISGDVWVWKPENWVDPRG